MNPSIKLNPFNSASPSQSGAVTSAGGENQKTGDDIPSSPARYAHSFSNLPAGKNNSNNIPPRSSIVPHSNAIARQTTSEDVSAICEGIKKRLKSTIDFSSLSYGNIEEYELDFFRGKSLEYAKKILSLDNKKIKLQGKSVEEYRNEKKYPLKGIDKRKQITESSEFCAHGTNLSSIVSALLHTNSQLVPQFKASKLGVGLRSKELVPLSRQRYVETLPAHRTCDGNFVFDLNKAKYYSTQTSAVAEERVDSPLKSDSMTAIVLGDGLERGLTIGEAEREMDESRKSSYKRVNIRTVAVADENKALVAQIFVKLGISDVDLRTYSELSETNHWPKGIGKRICEEVMHDTGVAPGLEYRTRTSYPIDPVDLRPASFQLGNICAHGTNLTAAISALAYSNKQLIPHKQAEYLGIKIRTGESGGIARPENIEHVSTHGFSEAVEQKFNFVRRYARSASETHGGFLKKSLFIGDGIPVVILGDGTSGGGLVSKEEVGVQGEYRYRRVNIRTIATDEFNKSLVLDVLRHLNVDDVNVCTFDDLSVAKNGFLAVYEKADFIKGDPD